MNSPIKWYGSKVMLSNKLISHIPEHTAYVEVFGGSAALLFAKPPSQIEIYNDIDSGLVRFFRVLQDETLFAKFERLVNAMPFSRERYNEYRETWESEKDKTLSAAQWFVVARQSFSGSFSQGWAGVSKQRRPALAWLNIIKELPSFHDRMMRVQIEHRGWDWVLNSYDAPETFFYLDPPYIPSSRRRLDAYTHELNESDHEKLIARLPSLTSKVLLSGYRNELYDSLGWHRTDYDAVSSTANSKYDPDKKRVESVWQNYETQMSLF